jgi:hypothetical protein
MKPVKFCGIGWDQPQDFVINWNLGNSCNWSCEYCPKWLNDGSIYWQDNELVKKVLLQIKQHLPDRQITIEFTGGEVTTNPNFIELAKFCKEQGVKNYINTNASRTVAYWERLCPYLFSANCAFHPMQATKEHYESVIDMMIKYGIRPTLSLAMVKDVFWDMVAYKKYLQEKYYDKAHVDVFLLYDKQKQKTYNGYFYDYDTEQKEYLTAHVTKNYLMEYDDGTQRFLSNAELVEEKLNNFFGFLCGSQVNLLSIDSSGGASLSVCGERRPIYIQNESLDGMFNPTVCQSTICRNPSDLRILKTKID